MKYKVMVSKAAFDLRKGETVEMFLRQIRDELRNKFEVPGKRSNDWADEIWVMVRCVQPGKVIMERRGRGAKAKKLPGMEAVTFTRDPQTYKFSFSEPIEVMEEKEFVPVQKSADFQEMELESFWHGVV